MTFPKGHNYGNRFSHNNQPQNSGRKPSRLKILQAIFNSLDENERLSKEDILKLLEYIIICNKAQLETIARNPDLPMIIVNQIKAIVTDLASGKTDTVDKIFDRLYGKATISLEVTGAAGVPLIPDKPMSRKEYETMYEQLIQGKIG